MKLRNNDHRPHTFRHRYNRNQPDMTRRKVLLSIVGVTMSMAIGVTAGGLFYETNGHTLEPTTKDAMNSTTLHSILIDSSDPVSTNQSQQINNLLRSGFMENIKKGDQITVSILTHEQFDPIQWAFQATDPGRGAETNPLFETPGIVDKQREEGFLSQYYQAINAAQVPIDMPKTPLLTGIESLSRHHLFLGGFGGNNTFSRRRLLVVSDGLENAEVSAYNGTIYTKRGMEYTSQHLAALQGVEVTIALIVRQKHRHIQNERHWQWLAGVLHRSGAASVKRIDII